MVSGASSIPYHITPTALVKSGTSSGHFGLGSKGVSLNALIKEYLSDLTGREEQLRNSTQKFLEQIQYLKPLRSQKRTQSPSGIP